MQEVLNLLKIKYTRLSLICLINSIIFWYIYTFFECEYIIYRVGRVLTRYIFVRNVFAAIQKYRKQADVVAILECTTKGLY